MHIIPIQPDFHSFREAARSALRAGYAPQEIDLQDATVDHPLTLALTAPVATAAPVISPHVPKKFLQLAEIAAVHRDPERWNLLYRLLFRLQIERNLLRKEVDDDVAALDRLVDNVRRDLHKMHAFVRFRKIDDDTAAATQTLAPERYVAWYRPDHRILPLAAPFFAERFAVMQWTILMPDASAAWDPIGRELRFGPGTGKDAAPAADQVEELWRSYYGSIFNPARVNPEAMRSEMPVRYWDNLPEAEMIPKLLQQAEGRVGMMITQQGTKSTAAPFVPARHELPLLRRALPQCEGCDLFRHATQVVPGAGSEHARLVLVGEQPGDKEDLEGEPFVGPAGQVLRKALDEVGIPAGEIFMTNAVKHFKFVQRGKLRLHQNPRMSEINACKPWLLAELDALRPKAVLCLGASASKSLFGGTFGLMNSRGKVLETPYAQQVIATVHPSAVLRARDQQGHDMLYNFLRDDLALAWKVSKR